MYKHFVLHQLRYISLYTIYKIDSNATSLNVDNDLELIVVTFTLN